MVAVGMSLQVALAGGAMVGLSESCWFECGLPFGSGLYPERRIYGNVLALAGALAGAAYLLAGRWLRPTMSLVVYIFTVYGMAAVMLVIMALVSGKPLTGFSPPVWLFFFAVGCRPTIIRSFLIQLWAPVSFRFFCLSGLAWRTNRFHDSPR